MKPTESKLKETMCKYALSPLLLSLILLQTGLAEDSADTEAKPKLRISTAEELRDWMLEARWFAVFVTKNITTYGGEISVTNGRLDGSVFMIQVSPKRGCLVMTLDPWNPKQLIEYRVPRFSYPHQVKEKHSITPVIGGLDVEGQRVKWRGEATPGHDWLLTEHGIIVTRPDDERNGFSAKRGISCG